MKTLHNLKTNLAELTEQIQRGETQLSWRIHYMLPNPYHWKTWLTYILLIPDYFILLLCALFTWDKMPIGLNILTIFLWIIWLYLPFSDYSIFGIHQHMQWDRTNKKLMYRNRYGVRFVYERAHQCDCLLINPNGLMLYYDYGKTRALLSLDSLYLHTEEMENEIYSKIRILAQAIADDYGLKIIDTTIQ